MFEKTNCPVASVSTVRSSPLVALVKLTVALGTTAPDGSTTVPRTAPVLPLWAGAASAAKIKTSAGKMRKIVPRLNGI